jgi:hypothetical protein
LERGGVSRQPPVNLKKQRNMPKKIIIDKLKDCIICGQPIKYVPGWGRHKYESVKSHGGECAREQNRLSKIGIERKPRVITEPFESKWDYGRPGAFIEPWKYTPCRCRTCDCCGRLLDHRTYWLTFGGLLEMCDKCKRHFGEIFIDWQPMGANSWRGVRIPRAMRTRSEP